MEILDTKKIECPHKTQTEENTNKTNEGEQVVAGEAGNVDKSNETETDNRNDKEQSANNKLSTHEQSEFTEGIEQKESSEKKLGGKKGKKIIIVMGGGGKGRIVKRQGLVM